MGDFFINLFAALGQIVSNFGQTLGNVFTSGINLIYDTTNDDLTGLGMIMLLGLGTGLLIWGFKFIRRLIKVRTK